MSYLLYSKNSFTSVTVW